MTEQKWKNVPKFWKVKTQNTPFELQLLSFTNLNFACYFKNFKNICCGKIQHNLKYLEVVLVCKTDRHFAQ